ncbi:unnamed protein product [Amoebophrya sp. A120]|nr:unnamed protein product [Amoebophrya sp. A120]|eukprot:GSA120T00006176001.1
MEVDPVGTTAQLFSHLGTKVMNNLVRAGAAGEHTTEINIGKTGGSSTSTPSTSSLPTSTSKIPLECFPKDLVPVLRKKKSKTTAGAAGAATNVSPLGAGTASSARTMAPAGGSSAEETSTEQLQEQELPSTSLAAEDRVEYVATGKKAILPPETEKLVKEKMKLLSASQHAGMEIVIEPEDSSCTFPSSTSSCDVTTSESRNKNCSSAVAAVEQSVTRTSSFGASAPGVAGPKSPVTAEEKLAIRKFQEDKLEAKRQRIERLLLEEEELQKNKPKKKKKKKKTQDEQGAEQEEAAGAGEIKVEQSIDRENSQDTVAAEMLAQHEVLAQEPDDERTSDASEDPPTPSEHATTSPASTNPQHQATSSSATKVTPKNPGEKDAEKRADGTKKVKTTLQQNSVQFAEEAPAETKIMSNREKKRLARMQQQLAGTNSKNDAGVGKPGEHTAAAAATGTTSVKLRQQQITSTVAAFGDEEPLPTSSQPQAKKSKTKMKNAADTTLSKDATSSASKKTSGTAGGSDQKRSASCAAAEKKSPPNYATVPQDTRMEIANRIWVLFERRLQETDFQDVLSIWDWDLLSDLYSNEYEAIKAALSSETVVPTPAAFEDTLKHDWANLFGIKVDKDYDETSKLLSTPESTGSVVVGKSGKRKVAGKATTSASTRGGASASAEATKDGMNDIKSMMKEGKKKSAGTPGTASASATTGGNASLKKVSGFPSEQLRDRGEKEANKAKSGEVMIAVGGNEGIIGMDADAGSAGSAAMQDKGKSKIGNHSVNYASASAAGAPLMSCLSSSEKDGDQAQGAPETPDHSHSGACSRTAVTSTSLSSVVQEPFRVQPKQRKKDKVDAKQNQALPAIRVPPVEELQLHCWERPDGLLYFRNHQVYPEKRATQICRNLRDCKLGLRCPDAHCPEEMEPKTAEQVEQMKAKLFSQFRANSDCCYGFHRLSHGEKVLLLGNLEQALGAKNVGNANGVLMTKIRSMVCNRRAFQEWPDNFDLVPDERFYLAVHKELDANVRRAFEKLTHLERITVMREGPLHWSSNQSAALMSYINKVRTGEWQMRVNREAKFQERRNITKERMSASTTTTSNAEQQQVQDGGAAPGVPAAGAGDHVRSGASGNNKNISSSSSTSAACSPPLLQISNPRGSAEQPPQRCASGEKGLNFASAKIAHTKPSNDLEKSSQVVVNACPTSTSEPTSAGKSQPTATSNYVACSNSSPETRTMSNFFGSAGNFYTNKTKNGTSKMSKASCPESEHGEELTLASSVPMTNKSSPASATKTKHTTATARGLAPAGTVASSFLSSSTTSKGAPVFSATSDTVVAEPVNKKKYTAEEDADEADDLDSFPPPGLSEPATSKQDSKSTTATYLSGGKDRSNFSPSTLQLDQQSCSVSPEFDLTRKLIDEFSHEPDATNASGSKKVLTASGRPVRSPEQDVSSATSVTVAGAPAPSGRGQTATTATHFSSSWTGASKSNAASVWQRGLHNTTKGSLATGGAPLVPPVQQPPTAAAAAHSIKGQQQATNYSTSSKAKAASTAAASVLLGNKTSKPDEISKYNYSKQLVSKAVLSREERLAQEPPPRSPPGLSKMSPTTPGLLGNKNLSASSNLADDHEDNLHKKSITDSATLFLPPPPMVKPPPPPLCRPPPPPGLTPAKSEHGGTSRGPARAGEEDEVRSDADGEDPNLFSPPSRTNVYGEINTNGTTTGVEGTDPSSDAARRDEEQEGQQQESRTAALLPLNKAGGPSTAAFLKKREPSKVYFGQQVVVSPAGHYNLQGSSCSTTEVAAGKSKRSSDVEQPPSGTTPAGGANVKVAGNSTRGADEERSATLLSARRVTVTNDSRKSTTGEDQDAGIQEDVVASTSMARTGRKVATSTMKDSSKVLSSATSSKTITTSGKFIAPSSGRVNQQKQNTAQDNFTALKMRTTEADQPEKKRSLSNSTSSYTSSGSSSSWDEREKKVLVATAARAKATLKASDRKRAAGLVPSASTSARTGGGGDVVLQPAPSDKETTVVVPVAVSEDNMLTSRTTGAVDSTSKNEPGRPVSGGRLISPVPATSANIEYLTAEEMTEAQKQQREQELFQALTRPPEEDFLHYSSSPEKLLKEKIRLRSTNMGSSASGDKNRKESGQHLSGGSSSSNGNVKNSNTNQANLQPLSDSDLDLHAALDLLKQQHEPQTKIIERRINLLPLMQGLPASSIEEKSHQMMVTEKEKKKTSKIKTGDMIGTTAKKHSHAVDHGRLGTNEDTLSSEDEFDKILSASQETSGTNHKGNMMFSQEDILRMERQRHDIFGALAWGNSSLDEDQQIYVGAGAASATAAQMSSDIASGAGAHDVTGAGVDLLTGCTSGTTGTTAAGVLGGNGTTSTTAATVDATSPLHPDHHATTTTAAPVPSNTRATSSGISTANYDRSQTWQTIQLTGQSQNAGSSSETDAGAANFASATSRGLLGARSGHILPGGRRRPGSTRSPDGRRRPGSTRSPGRSRGGDGPGATAVGNYMTRGTIGTNLLMNKAPSRVVPPPPAIVCQKKHRVIIDYHGIELTDDGKGQEEGYLALKKGWHCIPYGNTLAFGHEYNKYHYYVYGKCVNMNKEGWFPAEILDCNPEQVRHDATSDTPTGALASSATSQQILQAQLLANIEGGGNAAQMQGNDDENKHACQVLANPSPSSSSEGTGSGGKKRTPAAAALAVSSNHAPATILTKGASVSLAAKNNKNFKGSSSSSSNAVSKEDASGRSSVWQETYRSSTATPQNFQQPLTTSTSTAGTATTLNTAGGSSSRGNTNVAQGNSNKGNTAPPSSAGAGSTTSVYARASGKSVTFQSAKGQQLHASNTRTGSSAVVLQRGAGGGTSTAASKSGAARISGGGGPAQQTPQHMLDSSAAAPARGNTVTKSAKGQGGSVAAPGGSATAAAAVAAAHAKNVAGAYTGANTGVLAGSCSTAAGVAAGHAGVHHPELLVGGVQSQQHLAPAAYVQHHPLAPPSRLHQQGPATSSAAASSRAASLGPPGAAGHHTYYNLHQAAAINTNPMAISPAVCYHDLPHGSPYLYGYGMHGASGIVHPAVLHGLYYGMAAAAPGAATYPPVAGVGKAGGLGPQHCVVSQSATAIPAAAFNAAGAASVAASPAAAQPSIAKGKAAVAAAAAGAKGGMAGSTISSAGDIPVGPGAATFFSSSSKGSTSSSGASAAAAGGGCEQKDASGGTKISSSAGSAAAAANDTRTTNYTTAAAGEGGGASATETRKTTTTPSGGGQEATTSKPTSLLAQMSGLVTQAAMAQRQQRHQAQVQNANASRAATAMSSTSTSSAKDSASLTSAVGGPDFSASATAPPGVLSGTGTTATPPNNSGTIAPGGPRASQTATTDGSSSQPPPMKGRKASAYFARLRVHEDHVEAPPNQGNSPVLQQYYAKGNAAFHMQHHYVHAYHQGGAGGPGAGGGSGYYHYGPQASHAGSGATYASKKGNGKMPIK